MTDHFNTHEAVWNVVSSDFLQSLKHMTHPYSPSTKSIANSAFLYRRTISVLLIRAKELYIMLKRLQSHFMWMYSEENSCTNQIAFYIVAVDDITKILLHSPIYIMKYISRNYFNTAQMFIKMCPKPADRNYIIISMRNIIESMSRYRTLYILFKKAFFQESYTLPICGKHKINV